MAELRASSEIMPKYYTLQTSKIGNKILKLSLQFMKTSVIARILQYVVLAVFATMLLNAVIKGVYIPHQLYPTACSLYCET